MSEILLTCATVVSASRFSQPGSSGVFLYKHRYHILQFTLLFMLMAGVVGFEPTMQESKSYALPLGYTPSMLSQRGTYLLDASLNTVSFSLNNMHYSIFYYICQDHFRILWKFLFTVFSFLQWVGGHPCIMLHFRLDNYVLYHIFNQMSSTFLKFLVLIFVHKCNIFKCFDHTSCNTFYRTNTHMVIYSICID